MFGKVCGFRVREWESYRTSRSFGYGYGSVTELPGNPGIEVQAYTHRSSGRVQNKLYPYPGYCGNGRTELTEIPSTGVEVLSEVPEVPGAGLKVLQNFQKFRVLWHGRTELTEVPGRYKNAVPIHRVFVALEYKNYRSSL